METLQLFADLDVLTRVMLFTLFPAIAVMGGATVSTTLQVTLYRVPGERVQYGPSIMGTVLSLLVGVFALSMFNHNDILTRTPYLWGFGALYVVGFWVDWYEPSSRSLRESYHELLALQKRLGRIGLTLLLLVLGGCTDAQAQAQRRAPTFTSEGVKLDVHSNHVVYRVIDVQEKRVCYVATNYHGGVDIDCP
jgi:hypothetical protein